MKRLSTSVLVTCFSLIPIHSWAVVDVPPLSCLPLREGTPLRQVGWRCVLQFDLGGNVLRTSGQDEAEATAKARLPKVYAVDEVDAFLRQRDGSINQLRKDFQAQLDVVKAEVPKQIGDKVEKVIKDHLRDVLRGLIDSDPDFRKTVATILKEN